MLCTKKIMLIPQGVSFVLRTDTATRNTGIKTLWTEGIVTAKTGEGGVLMHYSIASRC